MVTARMEKVILLKFFCGLKEKPFGQGCCYKEVQPIIHGHKCRVRGMTSLVPILHMDECSSIWPSTYVYFLSSQIKYTITISIFVGVLNNVFQLYNQFRFILSRFF